MTVQNVSNIDNKEVQTIPASNETAQVQNTTTESTPESAQEVNWRNYRQQREIERKQKEEAERRAEEKAAEAQALKLAMESLLNKNQPQQQNHNSGYEDELSEDERIERKVQAAIASREKQYEEQRRNKEQAEFPQRLNSDYKDFNQVCNTENLDYLDFHYPEITAGYKHMPDGYEKWAAVYKAVKKFVPNVDSKKDLAKMEKNMSKPQSISSAGTTQGANAMPGARLDEAKKADNWARMQKAMKGLS